MTISEIVIQRYTRSCANRMATFLPGNLLHTFSVIASENKSFPTTNCGKKFIYFLRSHFEIPYFSYHQVPTQGINKNIIYWRPVDDGPKVTK